MQGYQAQGAPTHQAYHQPAPPMQGYPQPAPMQGYQPQAAPMHQAYPQAAPPMQGYPQAAPMQGYQPQAAPVHQTYPLPAPQTQGYPQPAPMQGYQPQVAPVQPAPPTQGYPQPAPMQGYQPPPLPAHGYPACQQPMQGYQGSVQAYPPPQPAAAPMSGYQPAAVPGIPTQGYPPQPMPMDGYAQPAGQMPAYPQAGPVLGNASPLPPRAHAPVQNAPVDEKPPAYTPVPARRPVPAPRNLGDNADPAVGVLYPMVPDAQSVDRPPPYFVPIPVPNPAGYASAPEEKPAPAPPSETYPAQPSAQDSRNHQEAAKDDVQTHGTVKPHPGFNAHIDSQMLKQALVKKPLRGVDIQPIVTVVAQRNNQQRQQIRSSFRDKFAKDLMSELSKETSSDLRQAIIALMTPAADYDAEQLKKAIKGKDKETIIEILASRNNHEMNALKTSYQKLHGMNLNDDLIANTSGGFQSFVVARATAKTSNNVVDPVQVKSEAQALFDAVSGPCGVNETKFIQILSSPNHAQLRLVFTEFEKMSSRTIHDTIEQGVSTDIRVPMQALARIVDNMPGYFAERIIRSLKGRVDDDILIRVLVSRSEVDLADVKVEYTRKTGKQLERTMQDISGDYGKILMALVRGN